MFNRFTNRARKALFVAGQEAKLFNHDYIGTEHVLLGLVAEKIAEIKKLPLAEVARITTGNAQKIFQIS